MLVKKKLHVLTDRISTTVKFKLCVSWPADLVQ